jgi:hypothetical protein
MRKLDPRDAYQRALAEVLSRVEKSLHGAPAGAFPVRMYIAGGAALHLFTGARVTQDVDATFSRRMVLGEDIEVSYRDADGRARLMYLDRNYNDSLGLLHENAYRDSTPIAVPGVDAGRLEVRVLAPVDLAVSKLARLTDVDRSDIEILARKGLIDSARVRKRAEEALAGYVGDLAAVRASIEIACRLVDARRPAGKRKPRR